MDSTSIFQKLKVIMWKNLIIRRRHWIMFITEIALPVTLFMLLSYAQALVDNNDEDNESIYNSYSQQRFASELYNSMIDHQFKIFYTPKTTFTSSLIREAQLKLSLNKDAFQGFIQEDDLVAHYKKYFSNETIIGIIFNGLVDDRAPKHLNYLIRPFLRNANWSTDQLYTNGSPSYIHERLIAIQLAVDISFVEMNTKQFPYVIKLKEIYPSYRDNMNRKMFVIYLYVTTYISFIFCIPSLITRIVEEKISGIKELMKMMGLKSWMLWLGWFMQAFIVNAVSVIIITYLLKVPHWGSKFPALRHCDWSLFAVFLLLYLSTGVTYCFAISSLFNRPTIAATVGCFIWFFLKWREKEIDDWSKRIYYCLIPNKALYYGYNAIANYEFLGLLEVEANWSNMFRPAIGDQDQVTIGNVFIMFLVDMVVWTLFAVYFENIKPGPYGLAKPIVFPVTDLLKKIKKESSSPIESESQSNTDEYCKIEPPANLNVGIQAKKLYKKFGSDLAVNNLSIDIYEGQITALLGHNGAGKTTTMSIITGMIGATSGSVFINGLDIKHNMNKIHGTLGLCPQHNLQFTDLTVLEHLIFFGMLKGLTYKQAKQKSISLLMLFNMLSKIDSLAVKLSGGMRRKLSLGISLIGDSKVLILDEPTSGLDPESRRDIWDILLALRGSRTILITTHVMEEADVLGDRIAIMDHGRLVCYGTSMFLKNEYGAGCRLTLVRDEAKFYKTGKEKEKKKGENLSQVDEITSVIQNKIASAVLLSSSPTRLTYLLPQDMKPFFSGLLLDLETKKAQLCITNINFAVVTLEEVFIKAGEIAAHQQHGDDTDTFKDSGQETVSDVCSRHKESGISHAVHQLRSLFLKRIRTIRAKLSLFLIHLFIALVITFMVVYNEGKPDEAPPPLNLKMKLPKYVENTAFNGTSSVNENFKQIQEHYAKALNTQNARISPTKRVFDVIIGKGLENMAYRKQHEVFSAEFNSTTDGQPILTALYSNKTLHGASKSLNLLMNSVVKILLGEDYSISTYNFPLRGDDISEDDPRMLIVELWFLCFPLGILFYTGMFLLLPQMEKASNAKQLQFMCGVKSCSYWLTFYVFDLILFWLAVVLILAVISLYGCWRGTIFSGKAEIVALAVILVVHGLGVIPYSYLFSYKKNSAGSFSFYLMVNEFLSVTLTVFILLKNDTADREYYKNIFLWFPQIGLTYSTLQFSVQVILNSKWNNETPEGRRAICRLHPNRCCGDLHSIECRRHQSYFEGDESLSPNLLIMACSTLLYFALLFLLESTCIYKAYEKFVQLLLQICNVCNCKRTAVAPEEPGVTRIETDNVSAASGNQEVVEDLLAVKNLKKKFCRKTVVKDISFGVKPGDCFGLLGVNGAGKTTTFRMLTGDEVPTAGDAEIREPGREKSVKISTNASKYLQKVGYCPQFDAIIEILTGRQMLELFAELRGLAGNNITEEVNSWINLLGLDEYADKQCGKYSGGNKRKLSMAIALIANPPLVMLDEPTSGVDPVLRRKLWSVIAMIQNLEVKPSIVLTSHSMDECEALCNKLTIMKNGRLKCVGTISQLKAIYGKGFTVKFKLKIPPVNIVVGTSRQGKEGDSDEVKKLMLEFEVAYQKFYKLCDKHAGLLHYQLNDKNKKWSDMFKEIEVFSKKHPIIEDYDISETSLEEVFLSIARS